jgi:hypothetical protein
MIANTIGSGPALELHSSGAPITVDSSVKVNNLNADKVDGLDSTQLVIGEPGRGGGRLFAKRRTAAVPGTTLLIIPGMGRLFVDKCDGTVGQVEFNTTGTGPVDVMFSGIVTNHPFGAPPHSRISIRSSRTIGCSLPQRLLWSDGHGRLHDQHRA